jgi:hypothetical protein
VKNLDVLAAKAAQDIITQTDRQAATDVENLVTKALGVLQENGVYAALLYLYSRSSKNEQPIAQQTRDKLLSVLREAGLSLPGQQTKSVKDVLQLFIDQICDNLDRLLLVKQLWEQTLIYARYGAKAREAEKKEQEGKNKKEEAEVKA